MELLAGALREAFGEKSSEARVLGSAGGGHPDPTTVTGSWQIQGSDGGPSGRHKPHGALEG